MAEQISGIQFILSATAKNLTRGLNEARTGIAQLEKQTRGLQNILSGLGVGFGLYQVGIATRDAINVFKDFEYKMSEVKAITNATDAEFKKLSDDAIQLGRSTIFTATQVASLQVAYGRLGFTTKEILNATKATLDLAAATNSELADAAEVAGSTLRGFGLDASETIRVTDVMASSFNKTALDIENFREGMKFVAPIARAAGASIEETTALMGVLANAGIKGSIAGTSLRRIFSDLTRDGRPLRDRLEELAQKGLTLQGAYDEIGRVAQTSLLVLANNTKEAANLTSVLQKAAGETERVARIRLDNLEGDVVRLTSAWEGFLIAIQNSEGLRKLANNLTSFINRIAGQRDSLEIVLSDIGRILEDFGTIQFSIGESLEFARLLGQLSQIRQEMQKPIPLDVIDGIINRFNLSKEAASEFRKQVELINEQFSLTERVTKDFEKFAFGLGANVFDFKGEKEDLDALIDAATKFQESTRRRLGDLNTEDILVFGEEGISKERDELRQTLRVIDEYIAKKKLQSEAFLKQIPAITENTDASEKLRKEYEKLSALKIDDVFDFSKLNEGLDKLREVVTITGNFVPTFGLKDSFDDVIVEIDEGAEQIDSSMESMHSTLQQKFNKFGNLWRQGTADAVEWVQSIKDQVINFGPILGDFITGLSESIGDAVNGNFGEGFLRAVSDFMATLGQQMIALGIAKVALDRFTINMPGGAMIAAGVALVAASKAIRNTFSKGISGRGGGPSGQPGYSQPGYNTINQGGRLTLSGTLIGDGRNLVAVVDEQGRISRRTRGGG